MKKIIFPTAIALLISVSALAGQKIQLCGIDVDPSVPYSLGNAVGGATLEEGLALASADPNLKDYKTCQKGQASVLVMVNKNGVAYAITYPARNRNLVSALSTEGQFTCINLNDNSDPNWKIFREQLAQEAADAAKLRCPNGSNVFEVVSTDTTMAPSSNGQLGCFVRALVRCGRN